MAGLTFSAGRGAGIRRGLAVFLLFVGASTVFGQAAAVAPELRGMWVTRFEWPSKNGADAMKQSITSVMQKLEKNNFNAVFFQVRGQADCLFPSEVETWSPIVGERDPGFDPLAFAIDEAHRNGLEFHAYINAFPCWQGKTTPTNPDHVLLKHRDWLCRNADGSENYEEYFFLSPGIPEVQAHVRAVILDVVKRYGVDGIHLDRIRYPDRKSSHDSVSKARFAGPGNPGRLGWEDWQRAQVTLFVNDLYGQIQAVKPKVKLSASVWGIYDKTKIPGYSRFSSGFHDYCQDSQRWIQMGAMDALVPMIYWNIGGDKPDYDELYRNFQTNSGGRHIYGGLQTKYDDPDEPVREIQYTRSVNGQGTVGFSFGGVDKASRWTNYRQVYTEKAPVPPMTWKANPQMGTLLGRVTGADGKPVADAWVRIDGFSFVWLSSGDGVFSILNLPPGDYGLTVEKPGTGSAKARGVAVQAGRTAQIQIALH